MVYGMVLAGGYSSRADSNKMMLQVGDNVLIERTILQMLPHVDKIVVVTGHYHDDIVSVVRDIPKVSVVRNNHYFDGMFSSVQTGAQEIDGDSFIVPGDCPLICSDVYALLLQQEGEVRVPTHNGYKGHPLFLEQHLVRKLVTFDKNSNLKVFRDLHDVHTYETDCPGIFQDIDTLEDYKSMIERIEDYEDTRLRRTKNNERSV